MRTSSGRKLFSKAQIRHRPNERRGGRASFSIASIKIMPVRVGWKNPMPFRRSANLIESLRI